MQFPESWLRHFCNPPLTTQQLADALTMAGLEVEDVSPVGLPFSGVVVGLITETQPHPNADRLKICTVDVGEPTHLSIVCGASNAKVGMKVPCARVGAVLPGQGNAPALVIKLGQLRGVESQGMLCSAKELGLIDSVDGLLALADDAPVGLDIRTHLDLDDSLLTLKLTPNLAHCLSVHGVARELAAITGADLRHQDPEPVAVTHGETLPVKVEADDLCGRFSGRIVKGINAQAPTPRWMVDRLARCGQRSVSALVDISNYVMFETGQPTHIFDLAHLRGGLTVRWAKTGESLELLNGSTAVLDAGVGVIADDDKVESLAGIMGGQSTAVSDSTQDVYVEAAFWWPSAVAGR
ncbi:MAG: phenylalanine--tRNA ligase subunit beta, partial [Burkholderiaceae bacterium]|nr:phenylalanine--tRNA ligase subunit beta [Burkholderiaceae bacterium]